LQILQTGSFGGLSFIVELNLCFGTHRKVRGHLVH